MTTILSLIIKPFFPLQGSKSDLGDVGILSHGLRYPLLLQHKQWLVSLSHTFRTREGEIMAFDIVAVPEEIIGCLEFFDLILILL